MTGLHKACNNNCCSVIGLFCTDYRCLPGLINMKDTFGETAVMTAVRLGYLQSVVEMDLIEVVDFDSKNREGETLIEVAQKLNHSHVVQYLEGRIAKYVHQLYNACLEGDNSLVQDILAKSGVNNSTLTGSTLLHIAMGNNSASIVGTLLGCPTTRLDVQSELFGQFGWTPLHSACNNNSW